MQFDINDISAVNSLATNLAMRGKDIENQRSFIMDAMNRLGQTFEDEAYLAIKLSFERMSKRIDDVLPQMRALCGKLCDLYDALIAAQNAMN